MEQQERREDQATRNAVQALSIDMAKMTVLMESAEKARTDDVIERRVMRHDMNTLLNVVQGIPMLKDQITQMQATMARDISDAIAKSSVADSDLRAELMEKIGRNAEAIVKNTTDIAALKDRNSREDGMIAGAKQTAGWVWAVLGALAAGVMGVITIYATIGDKIHTQVTSGE